MTDLTEQWKKGELPVGEEYWVILTDEWYLRKPVEPVRAFYSCDCEFEGYYDDDIKEVLAPVPSYEEWKASYNCMLENEVLRLKNAQLKEYERIVTSYNMKPIDYDIACETVNKLLDDNKRLKHDVGNLGYKIKNQRHEIERQIAQNAQLKELLKECRLAIFDYPPYDLASEKIRLTNKIDEVLK